MKQFVLFIVASLFWNIAISDDKIREEKVAQIIEAQELTKTFQQMLDQSKAAATDLGRGIYKKILAETGVSESKPNPKMEAVFTRYVERCSTMFSAKEIVSIWSAYYGKDLSESDLDQILAYYKSPVGQKDLRSTQAAMEGFFHTINVETQKRMEGSVAQLVTDLKAAAKK